MLHADAIFLEICFLSEVTSSSSERRRALLRLRFLSFVVFLFLLLPQRTDLFLTAAVVTLSALSLYF